MSELSLPDAANCPARPSRLTVEFFEDADALMIRKRRGGGPWFFLLLWLVGWTVGCIFLIGNAIQNPAIGNFAFGLPFWASWLFVAGLVIWMVFGKETLCLGLDEAVFERRAFVRLSVRIVPRDEVQSFRECLSTTTENDEHLLGIEMLTLGKPLRFAYRLPDGEREWLIYQLNQFLKDTGSLSEAPGNSSATSIALDSNVKGPASSAPVPIEALTYERTLAAPPTDCNWHLADVEFAYEFWQQGQFSIGTLAGLLFINAFWNGIVSVFLLLLFGFMPMNNGQGNNAPVGWEWWGMFVFLIPFEVIGLGMLAALVVMMLEPWRRTSWQFGNESIVRPSRWPLFRRTRSWDVVSLDRLELRRSDRTAARRKGFSKSLTDSTGENCYALAIVSSDNVDLCEIDSLTEGEARWMAHTIFDLSPHWFGG